MRSNCSPAATASGCSSPASIPAPRRATSRGRLPTLQPLARVLRRSRLFGAQHARQCGRRRGAGPSTAAFIRSSSSRRPITCRARWPRLAHQLPDVALIPYPVVSDRLRIEPWWSNGDDHPAGAVGISQIPFRQAAHAVRLRDRRGRAAIASPPRVMQLRMAPQPFQVDGAHSDASHVVRPLAALQRAVLREHHRSHDRGAADDCCCLIRFCSASCAPMRAAACGCCGSSAAPPSNGAASKRFPQGACIVACKHQSAVGDIRAVRRASTTRPTSSSAN